MGTHRISGFTLIELSIVLVIIGLIVGGILMGREMIEAAQIRQQIGQLTEYQQGYNAFKNKYNRLPGDLSNNARSSFGLNTVNATGLPNTQCGNENGMIDSVWWVGQETASTYCEPLAIFADLSSASLVPDKVATTTYNASVDMGVNAPAMKFQPQAGLIMLSYQGFMGIFMGMSLSGITSNMHWVYQHYSSKVFVPQQAFVIDTKLDDGKPRTGAVIAAVQTTNYLSAETISNACITTSANNTYNTTEPTVQCFLWVRNP